MDLKQRAIMFLNNYNYYKNTELSNIDLNMARTIILKDFMQDLKIDKNGIISGLYLNEGCAVKDLGEGQYKIDKTKIQVNSFDEQENLFNANLPYIKKTKCYKAKLLCEKKCIYETCPYLIAINCLDACKGIAREGIENEFTEIKSSNISEENLLNSISYFNTNSNTSTNQLPQQLINQAQKPQEKNSKKTDKKTIIDIETEIDKINDIDIRNEFKRIYNRVSLMTNTVSVDLLPKLYLLTGDNKHLKNQLSELLVEILISNKKSKYQITNLLTDSKYAFEELITLVKNYDKVCNEGYFQQKELFLTTLYRLEEANGFVIIDTTSEAGIDLVSILNKNSIDIKMTNLEIKDYNEEELTELFKTELDKLGFTINDDVFPFIEKGYIKSYMKKHGRFKNKPLIDHLLSTICDNLTEKDSLIISVEDFPDLMDKSKEQQSVESKLSKLIGLQSVKKQLTDLISYLTFLKKMEGKINMPILNLHSVFSGSPGTGKTTIARIYANMLFELGYIKENKLIEVGREDLIAEYVGQTAVKTKKVFEKAMGGVLFIDEAYSLTPTNGTGFESECISTMIKTMEDRRDDIVVIFAGYENDMEKFLDANEGLRSRVTNRVVFNDYSVEELYQIFENSVNDLNLKLDLSAKPKIIEIISEAKKDNKFGNGRYIMNLRQKVLMKHAINTVGTTDEELLILINPEDFE